MADKIKTLWLYHGFQWWTHNNDLVHAFERIEVSGEHEVRKRTEDFIYFSKKVIKRDTFGAFARPGVVYEIDTQNPLKEGDTPRSLYFGTMKSKGQWIDTKAAELFAFESMTAETMADAYKQARNEGTDLKALRRALGPIAEKYQKIGTTRGRIAFELNLIQALRSLE